MPRFLEAFWFSQVPCILLEGITFNFSRIMVILNISPCTRIIGSSRSGVVLHGAIYEVDLVGIK